MYEIFMRKFLFGLLLFGIFASILPPHPTHASAAPIKSISANYSSTCVIFANHKLKCWGDNSDGQLGYDNTTDQGKLSGDMLALPFVNLGVGYTAKSVSRGLRHTCAILNDNRVKCWGLGDDGVLGYDSITAIGKASGDMAALTTIDLGAGHTAKAISAGGSHTCAILDNNTVKCWGDNLNGQLGYDDITDRGGVAGDMAALPTVDLGAGRTAKAISAGFQYTCALLDNNSIKCWGINNSGQLGQDDTINRGDAATVGHTMATLLPVDLGVGRTAKSVSASVFHTCAILDNNQVKCWGGNANGQLGYDDIITRGDDARDMSLLSTVNLGVGRTALALSLSEMYTCALLDNHQVKCWGDNMWGQLGYDDTTTRGKNTGDMAALLPINLGAGMTAKAISVGIFHTCVILNSSAVKCWGKNTFGELGYGDTTHRGNTTGSMANLQTINFGVFMNTQSNLSNRCTIHAPYHKVGCHLIGADLANDNLSGVDFRNIDMHDSDLSFGNHPNADFSNANLTNSDLAYSVLDGSRFTGANLDHADFQYTSLIGVSSGGITGTNVLLPLNWQLTAGYLVGPSADLRNAQLANADLRQAQLMYAQIAYGTLAGSNLANSDLRGADARGADLNGSDLTSATLMWSNLSWANLSNANLTGANLSGAVLAGVNFNGANLTGADLTNADLTGVNWQNTICPDGTNSDAHGQTCMK
jgi:uncharacterized protein YjbI with pentapeptide repeats